MKYHPTETWEDALEAAGNVLRPDAHDGEKPRLRTLARSYRVTAAAARLNLKRGTIEEALILSLLTSFVDPEGAVRIPAKAVEAAYKDDGYWERLAGLEIVHIEDIMALTGMNIKTLRRKLQQAGADRRRPEWGDIRGQWGLPDTYKEFKQRLWDSNEENRQRQAEEEERQNLARIEEEKRRKELQARLVAAFPDWTHNERQHQRVILHIGPPNSGKTHSALQALKQAGTGWYLAPLRLLAYEIFDRLNQEGVPCNLLTGEEYIPIPGATITAATIEMFNANASGECIIIDEAQMLADSDRGWAWTRAMIEANCPEIHMIAPASAQLLIQKMATAAELEISVEVHERLAPIKIADTHWSLAKLPPQTILVAFSRRTVLELKQELEQRGRSVSVVYGSLPPEVRRRQSDRFANGETEICVATDAVGMGLNLPADNVVFYEVEKFDGRQSRPLTPSEVQQIGGRAGRYGLSTAGEVGATTRYNLRSIRKAFYQTANVLTHARIAPTLHDLEMIPGTLAQKFREWSQLRSIPDSLRNLLKIANMEERISLAEMLSEREVAELGLASAVKLVNAPTRLSTRSYWRECSKAIIKYAPMPLPPPPPDEIETTADLDMIEHSVSSADIYLWLGHRQEFMECAPQLEEVRAMRIEWSTRIDDALLKKIRNVRLCSQCRQVLPDKYPYSMCNNCYAGRYKDFEVT